MRACATQITRRRLRAPPRSGDLSARKSNTSCSGMVRGANESPYKAGTLERQRPLLTHSCATIATSLVSLLLKQPDKTERPKHHEEHAKQDPAGLRDFGFLDRTFGTAAAWTREAFAAAGSRFG